MPDTPSGEKPPRRGHTELIRIPLVRRPKAPALLRVHCRPADSHVPQPDLDLDLDLGEVTGLIAEPEPSTAAFRPERDRPHST
ncbi:hypothetical protein JL475_18630 [Streptomyces sp. M2CJ-2]|uniref:hypothetical protein n=1 Tax=Streptomyces sp. M2CJ-2 TaxID=2803948 RepID=UPI0019284C42|nr:hypothetical protein [Streptomyces sp. M2CJ-2]MBL3667969.1 hypothetical protein [Streptomyces sp. M2CJ-2]